MKKRKNNKDKKEIFKIIGDYGKVLEQAIKFPIGFPESMLPFSKKKIKDAIKAALIIVKDKSLIENLKIGYTSLAEFIPDHEANLANANWEELQSTEKMNIKDLRKYINNKGLKKSDEMLRIWNKIDKDTEMLSVEINKFFRVINK